jgi:hypothetical protein
MLKSILIRALTLFTVGGVLTAVSAAQSGWYWQNPFPTGTRSWPRPCSMTRPSLRPVITARSCGPRTGVPDGRPSPAGQRTTISGESPSRMPIPGPEWVMLARSCGPQLAATGAVGETPREAGSAGDGYLLDSGNCPLQQLCGAVPWTAPGAPPGQWQAGQGAGCGRGARPTLLCGWLRPQ